MITHKGFHWIHYTMLLVGVLCISWSAILVKLAGISGLGSGFYRMFFATLGIIPLWIYFKKPIQNKRGIGLAILCGIIFACDIALWNTSILLSKASISTLLANLAPVWVGLGTILFLKERPKPLFWVGTSIALLGVTVIMGVGQVFGTKLNLGNTLAILASMFYGAYMLTAEKGRNTLDTFSFTTISMATSTLVFGLFCFSTSTPLTGFSNLTWIYLLALGTIPQLFGWIAINYALGHIKPTIASVSLLGQTIFTALFSVPVLGELLNFQEIVGAIVVLLGIFLVTKK
jgi:drug/metabolite transporter (DMT)-like permease